MAHLDPTEAFAHFQSRVLEGIRMHFPLQGKLQSVHLTDLEVKDAGHADDLEAQHKAKISGTSWTVPVYGHLELRDNTTGKVLDRHKIRLAEIPKMTRRYSYIMGGQEYQVDNQWQLKPGVYTRRRQNGELESRFNVSGKPSFDVVLEPDTGRFVMEYGKSKLPLYPVLKVMGVGDDELEKAWGKSVFDANKAARGTAGAVERFYKADKKTNAPSTEAAKQHLYDTLSAARLRPDATHLTLGKPFEVVTGEALRLATENILKVQAGHPEDDRDSLLFKDLRTAGDYAYERLRAAGPTIRAKLARTLPQAKGLRDVVKLEFFNKPIHEVFHNNAAVRQASQINPVEMVASASQTTIMGQGGIQSEQSVTEEAKFVNPSHLGFLDPICTPEGSKTGITLRLPLGLSKEGSEPRIHLFNLRSSKMELVSPAEVHRSKVVLPDQVTWKGGKPAPRSAQVKMNVGGKDIHEGAFADADYVFRHPSQLFNITANLIPFLGNTSGNRASMASRHIEQAISLAQREAPLVQSGTGVSHKGLETFENLLGNQAAHVANVQGTVSDITKHAVIVKDAQGQSHTHPLYHYYPLNDAKSVLHSTPLVKVGDKVHEGQTLADSNYTRQGTLALGTNLRVGYLPFKGYNFEDGMVISESAAKKLASEHLHKHTLLVDPDTVFDLAKFNVHHPGVFKKDQLTNIGQDGVVKVGAKVRPGDPLIVAMKPFKLKDRTGVAAIRRSLAGSHTDKSLRWDSDFEGEVVSTHKSGKNILVHVRTVEPMQVGDKSCFDEETEVLTAHGWKRIEALTLFDDVCTLVEGKIVYQRPTTVHRYPTGGRMYRIKSQQVDLFVTDNHRMYVQPRDAKDYGLHEAREIYGKRVRYLKNGAWQGFEGDPDVVTFPALTVAAGQFGRGTREIPAFSIPLRTYLGLLGAYLSNGSTVNQPATGSYGIAIDKATGPQFDALCAFLTEAGLTYTASQRGNCSRAIIFSKQLLQHFVVFGHALEKHIPNEVFAYSSEALISLFDWLMWGDGSSAKDKSQSYFTSSKRLADDVQRLCLHIGLSANIYLRRPAGYYPIKGELRWCADAYRVAVVARKNAPQVNHGHTKKQYAQEEYWVENYAKPVYCPTVPGHVLYVRRNGIPVWSGNSGRAGNKGIVTAILPDYEMPHTKDGKHIEVALNPSGVPGRMNVGQVLETAAGKIAQKTNKTYVVHNFEPHEDVLEKVRAELKAHGLSDTEELFDPATKQSLGQVLVGPLHMLKLVHQVDKKLSVRSGMALPGTQSHEHYDLNLQPTGGAGTGGQSMGVLGMYAMLAHGAKANIREMQTFKSEGPDPQTSPSKQWPSQHNQVWAAIQTGHPLPPPQPTFAFQKFTDMLRAAGVHVEKKGHQFALSPLTDKHILHMSAGALPQPTERLHAKGPGQEPTPRPGGLFDEKITGGLGGRKWSHIPLAEPVPNPLFAVPICKLTGLTGPEYQAVIAGDKAVNAAGELTEPGAGLAGGAGIEALLRRIDVPKDLARAKKELTEAKGAKVDSALKKVKYLQALDKLKLHPAEAYVLHHLPVLPPAMRPVSILPTGDIKYADVNGLYAEFAQVNDKLKDPVLQKNLTDPLKRDLRKDLYDGVQAIMGLGVPYADAPQKGLLHQISGSQPKEGLFQSVLMNRRQDLTMRSTIVPEPALGLDEVGLPKDAALTLFRPFVVKKLRDLGHAPTAADAQKLVAQKTPAVWRALEKAIEERPVLLKRDPALHKHSVQAFKTKLVPGEAIQIHPLVTGGFNADFDGNCYKGSTRILVRFGYKGSEDDITSALEAAYKMKFTGTSRVLVRTSDHALADITLEDMPRFAETVVQDRNGAWVYALPEGIEVWTYDHASNAAIFAPVTHITVEDQCPTVEVKTRRFSVTASTNESLCVYDPVSEDVVDIAPKNAVGRLCPVLARVPMEHGQGDSELGWLFGAFVSDGTISTSTATYTKASKAHRDRFAKALQRLQHTPISRHTYEEMHGDDCDIQGVSVKDHHTGLQPHVRDLLQSFYGEGPEGRSSLRKRLPPELGSFSEETLVGILSGLFDGDGSLSLSHAKDKPQVLASFSTSSPGLRDSVVLLAQLLGIRTAVSAVEPSEGRLQTHTNYVISFSIVDLGRYVDRLKVLGAKPKRALDFLRTVGTTKDDQDIVPIPNRLMELAASTRGPCGSDKSLQRTMATNKSTRKQGYYLSRALARRVLEHFRAANVDGIDAWADLVVADGVRWDIVESVIEEPPQTVYDLVVPSTKVFAVNGGLVVWDTMSVFVPVSQEAVAEAHKMMPSHNLFSEATGKVMYQPTLESALGLYKLSVVGKEHAKKYAHEGHVIDDVRKGHLDVTDIVHVGAKRTTPGRILLASALPEPLQHDTLYNLEHRLDRKGLDKLLTQVAKHHAPAFGDVVNQLKDLGNGASFGAITLPPPQGGGHTFVFHKDLPLADTKKPLIIPMKSGTHTLSLEDFATDKHVRRSILDPAEKRVREIYSSPNIPKADKDRRAITVWLEADKAMRAAHEEHQVKDPSNLFQMYQAGVKPGWDQYKQMVLAPMLLKDSADRIIPTPVTRSYAEGLDVGGYWTQMHGARRGAVMKVQEVQEPGYLSKLLMNNMMHLLVNNHDCGTQKGIALDVHEPDVHDRHLAEDFKHGALHVPAGTLLSPDVVGTIKAAKKDARLIVRSPLKCEEPHGLCQKCVGLNATGELHPLGTNIGVHSAHAVGERAVQLTLRSFHGGGAVEQGGGKLLNSFARLQQLTMLPRTIPNAASLAMATGKVTKIEKVPTGVNIHINGKAHFVGKDPSGMPLHESLAHQSKLPGYTPWTPPEVGVHLEAGAHLSDPNRTLINPHDLYEATGNIEKVQNHMTSEMYDLYKQEGVKRRTIETVIKAMGNLTKVHDPGDHHDVLRGEFRPLSVIKKMNADLVKQGKDPITHHPVLRGLDMLPLAVQEDWMAKLQHQRLKTTILEAAATGAVSNTHGMHPVPGMAVGNEFGLTKAHADKPGLAHLKDVPGHHY